MPPQSRGRRVKASKARDVKKSNASTAKTATSHKDAPPEISSEEASSSDHSLDNGHGQRQSHTDDSIGISSSISNTTPISQPTPRKPPFPRSQSYGPAAFAPPFYNRPPTPLPPSPSLTSLLRPLRMGTPLSRTTTPESSDTEVTSGLPANSTEAIVARSALEATTVPRASPKVPTYEYYGFVMYIGSSAAFLMYLLWSYLPASFLHRLGIYYYPNRWWSLALPAWLVMLVVYIYVALAAWNTGVLTLPLQSLECLVDEKARIAVVDRHGNIIHHRREAENKSIASDKRSGTGAGSSSFKLDHDDQDDESPLDLDWENVWNKGTDAVMDIPIGGVCEILYGASRDHDQDDKHDDEA